MANTGQTKRNNGNDSIPFQGIATNSAAEVAPFYQIVTEYATSRFFSGSYRVKNKRVKTGASSSNTHYRSKYDQKTGASYEHQLR